jgi:hypothetical protein
MWNYVRPLAVVVLALGMVLATRTAAGQAQLSWNGPAALGRWNLIGRGASDTPRAPDGIILNLNLDDPPNTLHSPGFSVSKRLVNAVQVRYVADIISSHPPVMRVGWLEDMLPEDDAEKCAVTVPIQTGRVTVVTVSLASSPCWTPDGNLRELAINIDQTDPRAYGSMRLLSIELGQR